MNWLVLLFASLMTFDAAADQIATRLKIASREYEAANYDKVITLLNPYSEELPAPGLMLLASSYSRREKYNDEARILRTLVSKNEKSYQAQMLLGQALQKEAMKITNQAAAEKVQTQAIHTLRTAVQLRPKFKPAFDALLDATKMLGNMTELRELVIEGIDKFGRRPDLLKEICRLDANGGFVAQAVLSCSDAVKSAPTYPDSYVYLAQALSDQNENTKSENAITKAANRFPASEFVQWAAGTVFMKKQNYPVSARYFGQAVKANPQSGRATFGYARALYESGQAKQALPFYVKACKLEPSKVTETFLSDGSRLRLKGDPIGQQYKELATTCYK